MLTISTPWISREHSAQETAIGLRSWSRVLPMRPFVGITKETAMAKNTESANIRRIAPFILVLLVVLITGGVAGANAPVAPGPNSHSATPGAPGAVIVSTAAGGNWSST